MARKKEVLSEQTPVDPVVGYSWGGFTIRRRNTRAKMTPADVSKPKGSGVGESLIAFPSQYIDPEPA